MAADGTVENLLRWGDQYGVDRFVVHSVATTAKQVDSINAFLAEQVQSNPSRLIGFAALHPESNRIPQQVEEALQMGLTGVKLHPDFQEFHIDDEKAFPIYEAIEGRMPLLVHTGDSRTEYSKPWRLAKILDRFPKLNVIAAHFGGYSEWENGALSLALKNVYVDTSSSQFALTPHQVRELIGYFRRRSCAVWDGLPNVESGRGAKEARACADDAGGARNDPAWEYGTAAGKLLGENHRA